MPVGTELEQEIRLVYFDIRGLAEPLRWMLRIAEKEFIDERIPLDAWVSKRKRSSGSVNPILLGSEAKVVKRKSQDYSMTLMRFQKHIGQLPLLYVGNNFILTQTLTVMRYIARRFGFIGDGEMEEGRADEVADLVYDLRLCTTLYCFFGKICLDASEIGAANYEGKAFKSETPDIVRHTVFRDFKNAPESIAKDEMKKDLKNIYFPLYFSKFAALLEESGGEYVAGKKLTYGDLMLVSLIEVLEDLVDPDCLAEFPTLEALKQKINAIPQIEQWKKTQTELALEEEY